MRVEEWCDGLLKIELTRPQIGWFWERGEWRWIRMCTNTVIIWTMTMMMIGSGRIGVRYYFVFFACNYDQISCLPPCLSSVRGWSKGLRLVLPRSLLGLNAQTSTILSKDLCVRSPENYWQESPTLVSEVMFRSFFRHANHTSHAKCARASLTPARSRTAAQNWTYV